MKKSRLFAPSIVALLTVSSPAFGGTFTYGSAVKTNALTNSNGNHYMKLWDIGDEGHYVRGQYRRQDGFEYNIYNTYGYNTVVSGPAYSQWTTGAILCIDYPILDDCSDFFQS